MLGWLILAALFVGVAFEIGRGCGRYEEHRDNQEKNGAA